jgi:hypothetical protein
MVANQRSEDELVFEVRMDEDSVGPFIEVEKIERTVDLKQISFRGGGGK